jgi:hypothetical protein
MARRSAGSLTQGSCRRAAAPQRGAADAVVPVEQPAVGVGLGFDQAAEGLQFVGGEVTPATRLHELVDGVGLIDDGTTPLCQPVSTHRPGQKGTRARRRLATVRGACFPIRRQPGAEIDPPTGASSAADCPSWPQVRRPTHCRNRRSSCARLATCVGLVSSCQPTCIGARSRLRRSLPHQTTWRPLGPGLLSCAHVQPGILPAPQGLADRR